jgi:hypothetical protein
VEDVLATQNFTIATGISLLEFKATLIRECILIYNNLRARRRFTHVRDALLEKKYAQLSLRAHILNNLVRVQVTSSFEINEEEDRRLAEDASLQLRRVIPRLYRWFLEESAHSVQWSEIDCTRAKERPELKRVAFVTNLPMCRPGKNRFCRIESFIREQAKELANSLPLLAENSEQLQAAHDLMVAIIEDPDREDLSHGDCRKMGDCLIALEGRVATHVVSTNKRDWEPICQLLGIEFVGVDYPEEKTI